MRNRIFTHIDIQEEEHGNPGGLGEPNGSNGTGGLLILYANSIINNKNITSDGKKRRIS